MVCMLFLSIHTFGQSEISMFQLIKKPIAELSIDSLTTISDSVGSLGNIFGDSVNVSAICMITDTLGVYSIHLEIGNTMDGTSNIYSDSLELSLIPSVDSLNIYRSGRVIYMDFGVFEDTDTLYGESWLYRNNGESSTVKYYPEY